MRLLVTRPQPDAERTAARLRALGHEVVVAPMLRTEAIADAELGSGPWSGVLFTSTNAVRAAAAHRRAGELTGMPAYVVGSRTREAAAAAGFTPVLSADGAVDDLIRLVTSQPPATPLPLLYCAGQDQAADLAGVLGSHGLSVATAVVYRTVMATEFPAPVAAALECGRVDAVLHYSPRTATAFVASATPRLLHALRSVRHICLSAKVAAPLVAAGAREIAVASAPNEPALFAMIGPA